MELVDKYEGVKHLLEELETEKAIGTMVRSRVKWYEEGEKSTKFFFNLEKHNYIRKFILKLHTNDGYILTNREEILEYVKKFYINIYSTREYDKDPSNKSYFWHTNTPKISKDNRLKCDKMLTKQECEDALKKIILNKTPGNDGIPTEFYFKFWNIIGKLVTSSFNTAYDIGKLSVTQRQAVITLLEKKIKIEIC